MQELIIQNNNTDMIFTLFLIIAVIYIIYSIVVIIYKKKRLKKLNELLEKIKKIECNSGSEDKISSTKINTSGNKDLKNRED